MTDQQYGFTPGPPGPPGPDPQYGFTPGQHPHGAPVDPNQGNGMAVAGLVLGIIGLVLFFVPFICQILALLGIIFGALGMGKAKKIGGKGNGMAVTGLILGVLAMIVSIAFIFYAMNQAKRARGRMFGDVGLPVPASDSATATPDRTV